MRRTVWDGDQELYETQAHESEPENDYAPTPQIAGTAFDPNTQLGRVLYTRGLGIDQPLSVIRMAYGDDPYSGGDYSLSAEPFAVFYLWDTQGQAPQAYFDGFTALQSDGQIVRYRDPNGDGYAERIISLVWLNGWDAYGSRTTAAVASAGHDEEVWMGSLLDDKQDASGLLYRRNRYYDPQTGRFTQEDPIGFAGGINLYGFAAGDPVSYSDPYGLWPCPPDDDCDYGPTLGAGCPAIADHCNAMPLIAETPEEAMGRTVILLGAAGAGFGLVAGAEAGAAGIGARAASLQSLRAEYVSRVAALAETGRRLLEAGYRPETVARTLHTARRALSTEYKQLTPLGERLVIYARNLLRYGDRLGPTVENLRARGKSWMDIIESASRAGGRDLGL